MSTPVGEIIISALYVYGRALFSACAVVLFLIGKQLLSPTKLLFTVKSRESPPKCLLNKDLGQHGYVTVKGNKFHFVEKGDRSKPLMLFVHGFPEFWYSWRHQMKEFCNEYWTVAIDMRGYGDSVKPPNVSDYRVELLVDDVKGIVTELGKKTFTLVGHDWGAFVSWIFVDKYPDMVEKYIMMNGPHPKVFSEMMKTKEQSLKSWYMFFFLMPFLPEIFVAWKDFEMFDKFFLSRKKTSPFVTNDDIEAFKYTFSQPGSCSPPLNWYRAAMRRRALLGLKEKKYAESTMEARPPGLYIFGKHDIAIDIRNVELLKKYFQPLETVIIDGNHFIQQDEPEAVNNAMQAFLKK